MAWNPNYKRDSVGIEGADQVEEYYDADDQKYLNIQRLDRIRIIFIQMIKCSQLASTDPRGKGKYIKQVIGRAIPIMQDLWLDDPHVAYYHAVRQLYVLVYPEFLITDEYVNKYNELLAYWKKKKFGKYDYNMTERLHRMLVKFVEDTWGKEVTIIDRVD
jgi:hypothetical protein